jgi:hypothetical protein
LLDVAVKVANVFCDLHAGVEFQCRINGTMSEKLANNLVRSRIGLEEEVASQVPELVCCQAHSHLGLDEISDLFAQQ